MRLAQKRTPEDLSRDLGKLLKTIQRVEFCNYLHNAGYASVKL